MYEPKEFSFSVKPDPLPVRDSNLERVRVAVALALTPIGVWLAACIILLKVGAA